MPTIKEHRQAAERIESRYTGYTFEYMVNGRTYYSYGQAMRAAIAMLKREVVVNKLRRRNC